MLNIASLRAISVHLLCPGSRGRKVSPPGSRNSVETPFECPKKTALDPGRCQHKQQPNYSTYQRRKRSHFFAHFPNRQLTDEAFSGRSVKSQAASERVFGNRKPDFRGARQRPTLLVDCGNIALPSMTLLLATRIGGSVARRVQSPRCPSGVGLSRARRSPRFYWSFVAIG